MLMNNFVNYVLLALIFLIALGLRTNNLGHHDWHYDEAFHVFSARSINDHGNSELPSGTPYKRAPLVTALGALSMDYFGESRFHARLPAAVIGSFAVLALFFCVNSLFGPRLALISSAIFAFSPLSIALSKFFRYYYEVQLSYILILGVCILFFRESHKLTFRFTEWSRLNLLKHGALALIFVIALYIIYLDNKISFVVLPAIGLVIALRFFLALRNDGIKHALSQSDFLILAVGFLSALIFCVFALDSVKQLYWQAISHQMWTAHNANNNLYYLAILLRESPILFVLTVPGAWYLCMKYRWAGLICIASLVIPLLLMSTIFTMRMDRYIGFLIPVYCLISAAGLLFLYETLKSQAQVQGLNTTVYTALFSGILILAIYATSGRILREAVMSDFSSYEGLSSARFDRAITNNMNPLISCNAVIAKSSLLVEYYLGERIDFVFSPVFGDMKYRSPSKNHYSGASRIETPEQLIEVVEQHEEGCIILSDAELSSEGVIPTNLRKVILQQATRINSDTDEDVAIYKWQHEPLPLSWVPSSFHRSTMRAQTN